MNINQVFTPFAFYSDILLQNRFKPQCKNDCLNPLISPNNRFLNFQFRVTGTSKPVTAFELYDLSNNLILTIPNNYIRSFSSSGYDYHLYFGDSLTSTMECGEYYLKITTIDLEFFSEVFEVKKFIHGFEPSVYGIIYNGNFANHDFWQTSAGWTIWGNTAICTSTGITQLLSYLQFLTTPFPYPIGERVRVTFTLTGYVAGTLNVNTDYNLAHGVNFSANGVYSFILTVYNSFLNFSAGTTFSGIVSNVKVETYTDYKNCDKIYLRWRNTCDLYNIKYADFSNINGAVINGYANELFLETRIGEPEYREFEEVSEDGEFNKIQTFAKNNKWFKLNTLLIAEFLVDSFSIIKEHDSIKIYDPYKDELHEVEEIEIIPEWFDDACFASNSLTWKDFDLIKDACCNVIPVDTCFDCTESILDITTEKAGDYPDGENIGDEVLFVDTVVGDYYEGWVYIWSGTAWVKSYNEIGDIICFSVYGEIGYYINVNGVDLWYPVPYIILTQTDFVAPFDVLAQIFVMPNVSVTLQYRITGSGDPWTEYELTEDQMTLLTGIHFSVPSANSWDVRIRMYSLTCDWGYSDTFVVTVDSGGGGG